MYVLTIILGLFYIQANLYGFSLHKVVFLMDWLNVQRQSFYLKWKNVKKQVKNEKKDGKRVKL